MVDLPPGFRVAQGGGAAAVPNGFRVVSSDAVPTAQERYDSALAKVRGLGSFKDWSDESFNAFSKAKLQPYNAQELAQNAQIFSFGDEIAAGSSAATDQVMKWLGQGGEDFGTSWQAWQDLQSARQELGREQAGLGGTAAEIGGALMSAAPTAMIKAGNIGVDLIKGTAAAGTGGFLQGFGGTDGDLGERAKGGAGTAALTAPMGAAGTGIARGIESLARRGAEKAAAKQAPKAAEIINDSRAAYTAADNADVLIRPEATSLLRQDLNAFVQKKGVVLPNGKIEQFPKVRKALKQLDSYASADMSIPQFQRFEEALQAAAGSNKPGEAALGREMLGMLDGYIDSLPQSAYRGTGSGTDAAANWAKGKQLYAQGKRTKTIEKLIYDARFSGNNDFAGSLRQGFASFLRSDKKRRGFSPDEIAAIERFVQGGPVGGMMKALAQGGGLPGGIWGGFAAGPAGAVAAPVLGAGARAGLNGAAATEADLIRSLVSGSSQQGPKATRATGVGGLLGESQSPWLDEPSDYIEGLLFSR